jgi:hypothetical protein
MSTNTLRTVSLDDPAVVAHLKDRKKILLHYTCSEGGKKIHSHYAGRDARPYIIKGARNKRYLTECVILTSAGDGTEVQVYMFKTDYLSLEE